MNEGVRGRLPQVSGEMKRPIERTQKAPGTFAYHGSTLMVAGHDGKMRRASSMPEQSGWPTPTRHAAQS